MTDLPRITCDDDWVDLALDEQALLTGKLDHATTPDSASVMICTIGWQVFVVEVGRTAIPALPCGTEVSAIVARDEDGMRLVEMKEVIAA